jgi:ABC-2 type transport system ATP-binding protein
VGWLGDDGPRRVQTDEPTRLVAELGARFDGEVPGLTVTRPTLEDIYLELIGDTQ